MEFVLVLAVIIVICKILGVSNEMIVAGGLVLIELTIIAMMLLFAYCCVRMIFTKRKKARFTRIDRVKAADTRSPSTSLTTWNTPAFSPARSYSTTKCTAPTGNTTYCSAKA